MADLYITGLEERIDVNGMRLFSLGIRNRKKRNYLENRMIDGVQIVGGAALAVYTCRSNFHPMWLLGCSAVAIEGAANFYANMRKYFRYSSYYQRERTWATSFLAFGTFNYIASVVLFSRTLKQNSKLWIPCLGVAATGYYLSVSSNNRLARTVFNRKPALKCYQLLFGQMLIGGAADYLLNLQKHDEEWLRYLPWIASTAAANHISLAGYRRVKSNNEPRWLLFKGLELLVGGCIICINGAVAVVYAVNNQFHSPLILFFTTVIFKGVMDINNSLKSFQGCVEMERRVFYCICDMIGGSIIFFSAFLGVRYVDHPMILPAFIVLVGTGFHLLFMSIGVLDRLVSPREFKRYCKRVLGPVLIAYSSSISAYTGYRMGWRFGLVVTPLIPAGIYITYRGWK